MAFAPFYHHGLWVCEVHVLASYMKIYVLEEGLQGMISNNAPPYTLKCIYLFMPQTNVLSKSLVWTIVLRLGELQSLYHILSKAENL